MTRLEDTIWQHLVEYHDADRVELTTISRPPHRRLAVLAGAGAGIATAATAAVLLASSVTQPAYALRMTGTQADIG
jgi:hypothetical protein